MNYSAFLRKDPKVQEQLINNPLFNYLVRTSKEHFLKKVPNKKVVMRATDQRGELEETRGGLKQHMSPSPEPLSRVQGTT